MLFRVHILQSYIIKNKGNIFSNCPFESSLALIFLFCFVGSAAYAADLSREEFEEEFLSNYQIDNRYKAGKILLYDCEKHSFTCVDQDSIEICEDRNIKRVSLDPVNYSCVRLREYKTRRECLLVNLKVIEEQKRAALCLRSHNFSN